MLGLDGAANAAGPGSRSPVACVVSEFGSSISPHRTGVSGLRSATPRESARFQDTESREACRWITSAEEWFVNHPIVGNRLLVIRQSVPRPRRTAEAVGDGAESRRRPLLTPVRQHTRTRQGTPLSRPAVVAAVDRGRIGPTSRPASTPSSAPGGHSICGSRSCSISPREPSSPRRSAEPISALWWPVGTLPEQVAAVAERRRRRYEWYRFSGRWWRRPRGGSRDRRRGAVFDGYGVDPLDAVEDGSRTGSAG